MVDRTAASLGVVIAGLALVAAAVGWSGPPRWLAVGIAGVGAVGFSLRRHGAIGPSAATAMAGGAGLALLGIAAAVGTGRWGAAGATPMGNGGVAGGGALMLLAGYADVGRVSRDRAVRTLRAGLLAVAVGAGGFVMIQLWGSLLATLYVVAGGTLTAVPRNLVSTVAVGAGATTAGAAFIALSGRCVGFIDLDPPTRRDALYVGGGILALLGLNLLIGVVFRRLGLETAQHSILVAGREEPLLLLAMVPLSYLVIGPSEELLFRNLAQKPLYEYVSRRVAIVLASGVFAALHFSAYTTADSGALQIGLALATVFALSLLLGWIYHRTENVVVPALVHGTFNAVGFAIAYAQVTGLWPG